MQCLSCQSAMQLNEIAPNLKAQQCTECAGIWLDLNQYQRWASPIGASEMPAIESAAELLESTPSAIFCPDCQQVMHKYRVAPQHAARIDRCAPCRKVWLDHAEWQYILANKLTLLALLSDKGQREIREAESQQRLQATFESRFGAVDFARIEDIKAWLNQHPKRREILAYLQGQ